MTGIIKINYAKVPLTTEGQGGLQVSCVFATVENPIPHTPQSALVWAVKNSDIL